MTITSSTIADNSGFEAGGVFSFGSLTVKSTILGSNSGGNCLGNITDGGYNISDDITCGFAQTGSANNGDGVNPLLAPALANNGGPTQTIALLSGSPAIDAIALADCTDQQGSPLTTDQRGFPRPDFGEIACDIGAFESQESFAGQPGKPNCHGQSVSALSNQYEDLNAAATALGFPNVKMLQAAIMTFCGG
jgi:hypothetical protein